MIKYDRIDHLANEVLGIASQHGFSTLGLKLVTELLTLHAAEPCTCGPDCSCKTKPVETDLTPALVQKNDDGTDVLVTPSKRVRKVVK